VEGVSDEVGQVGRGLGRSRRRRLVWTMEKVVDVASAELRDDFMTIVRILCQMRKKGMTRKLTKLTACLDELEGRLEAADGAVDLLTGGCW
jgi:hypothetical protein